MARLLKDPLLHFVLLGAAIFVFFAVLGEDEDAAGRRIVVSGPEIASLTRAMAMLSGQTPSEQDILNLIEPQIREEVLYREALALGLERDDSQIRQRLVEKMTFLSEDLISAEPPSEAELAAFFAEHADEFEQPATITFEQIYFSPSEHGTGVVAAAEDALARIRGGESAADFPRSGSMAPQYDAANADALRGELGQEFADGVFAVARDGLWQGPIRSFFGAHLVRVTASTDAQSPPLDDVRDRVQSALLSERRRQANEAAYRELRERYEIVIEIPEEIRQQWASDSAAE